MTAWTNNDGLTIRYGVESPGPALGGMNPDKGAERTYVIEYLFSDLAATGATKIFPEIDLPANFQISKVEHSAIDAFASAGSAGTLDIGLIRHDRTTAVDLDGLGDGLTQANMNANTYDTSTGTAVLVGTKLANAAYLVLIEQVAAFTAGKGRITITGVQL